MNVLLIRRPSRQRPTGPGIAIPGDAATAIAAEPRAWALADTSPDSERVVWGSWDKPADLLGLDLAGPLPAAATASGPQRLALICTNGKRDQCCAIRGRPVAEALAAVPGWDTAVRLGDSRRQAFRVARARRLDADERWEVLVSHLAEPGREVAYRVIVAPATSSPAFLSCADDASKADLHYTAITFSRAGR